MKGYRKIVIGFTGVIALFLGGFFLPEYAVNPYMYATAGIISVLIGGNVLVHKFQNNSQINQEKV